VVEDVEVVVVDVVVSKDLVTSSNTEDFPTPVSPTSRMVYGTFALYFDVLMIPLKGTRDSIWGSGSGTQMKAI
jgi:hypothetical protein